MSCVLVTLQRHCRRCGPAISRSLHAATQRRGAATQCAAAELAPPPSPSAFPAWRPLDFFHFEILHQSRRSGARVGRIHTPHGIVDTPGFVAVGTNAALKFVNHRDAEEAGLQLMFCNTYHLLVHPGPEVVEAAGGLHRFMRRDAPLITDSGGFQIFSMQQQPGQLCMPGDAPAPSSVDGSGDGELKSSRHPNARHRYSDGGRQAAGPAGAAGEAGAGSHTGDVRVSEEGVTFRSYRDGTRLSLSPESTVEHQKALGADIIVPLDELPSYHTGPDALRRSLLRTHRWEARSLRRHLELGARGQAMYAVVHGGVDRELRRASAEYLTALPFDGFAVGGAVGRDHAEMLEMLGYLLPMLPAERPRHLLGVADDVGVAPAVRLGVDTFDSCFPTRLGRHGTLLTPHGRLSIRQSKWRSVHRPPPGTAEGDESAHTLAYLHHLWKAHEPLVHSLLALHNIKFMTSMCRELRERIMRDEL